MHSIAAGYSGRFDVAWSISASLLDSPANPAKAEEPVEISEMSFGADSLGLESPKGRGTLGHVLETSLTMYIFTYTRPVFAPAGRNQ